MLLYLRIGGVHRYQIAFGVVDFKSSPRIGNGLAGFRIYLDYLQISFKFRIVDKVFIGFSVFVDDDCKSRHELSAFPAFDLFNDIFAKWKFFALRKAIGIADQSIPFFLGGGVKAACGFEINLESSPFLRGFYLRTAVIGMFDDGNIPFDYILTYAYRDGVMLNLKVSGVRAYFMDGFI